MKDKLNTKIEEEYEMKSLTDTQPPSPKKPLTAKSSEVSWLKFWSIICLAIGVKVLQPLAIARAKNDDGSYRFNESTMVLLVEGVKLIFCTCVFLVQYNSTPINERSSLVSLNFLGSLHFLVPAVLYAASNTLVYYGMSYINPALFHVFGNIRILTAGVLYRLMMHKKQTDIQWLAMLLIAAGAVLSSPAPDKKNPNENYVLGLVFVVIMAVCSTSASIYTEKYFKKTGNLSIFFQNIVLYLYGIAVNIIVVFATRTETKGIFDGFDTNGLGVLLVQSAMGVSLSFIFKYLDNIVYVISLTVSMLLTALFSAIFFSFSLTIEFISAIIVVTIGIYFFYRNKVFEKYNLQENDTLI